MDFGPVRSWILEQLPESMRPPLRDGYRLTRDVASVARTRRGWVNASRVLWLRPEVADLDSFRLLRPGPGEVLLKAHASLISPGTERAFLLGLPNTNASFPSIAGYSNAGVIAEVGKGVTQFKAGDRVTGVAPHASHACVAPGMLVRIPDGVSDEDASFVELGVIAMQGVRRAAIQPGEKVVVIGQGLIGQLTLQLARWAGAAPLLAAARSDTLADIASASGADQVIAFNDSHLSPEQIEADVVLEVTGSTQAVLTSLRSARRGGRVALLGSARGMTAGVQFDELVSQRDLTLIGAHITSIAAQESAHGRWTRRDEAELFLDLVASKHIDPQCLIAERVSPADANEVYDNLVAGRSRSLGIVFDWKNLRRTQKPMAAPVSATSPGKAPARKLRVGLIGCGEISAHNAAGIRASKYCELSTVMDLQEETAASLGKQFGVAHTTDMNVVLQDPQVDAVVIAVPHNLHAAITKQAAEAGKHVIVEKPIATTIADTDAMIEDCKRAGVTLSVLFSFRYQPHIMRARELVQAGALGDIVGTSIQFATEKPAGYWGQGYTGRVLTDWRGSWEKCGGGVLIMNVCHTIDYFKFITGLEVSQIYSEFSTLNSPVEVEDIIAVTLRYEGGGIGSIQAATLARGEAMAEERIWGTHGSMTLAPGPPQIYTMRRVGGLTPGRWQGFGKLPDTNRVADYMDRLAQAIDSGSQPEVTGLDGRENLAVVLAAYEAGRAGRAVSPNALESDASEATAS